LLIVKKEEEITEGKIYSTFGNLAERAKILKTTLQPHKKGKKIHKFTTTYVINDNSSS